MIQLVLWFLISYGIVQIIVDMTLLDGFKSFLGKFILTDWISEMMECKICTATWIGMGLSIFFFSPTLQYFPYSNFYLSIFLDGMLCSCIVWFLHIIEKKILE